VPDAAIVSACPTAIGTARKGTLSDSDPYDLALHVVGEAIARASVDASVIDEVFLGETAAWTFVPAAGALLADWGADLVRIEDPQLAVLKGAKR
jgi:acetyl-CoA acetyltransferase